MRPAVLREQTTAAAVVLEPWAALCRKRLHDYMSQTARSTSGTRVHFLAPVHGSIAACPGGLDVDANLQRRRARGNKLCPRVLPIGTPRIGEYSRDQSGRLKWPRGGG